MATQGTQKFAVGDRVRIKQHAKPDHWRGREAWITTNEKLGFGSHNVYRAEWVEDNKANTSFYEHEMELIASQEARTIKINVDLDFDVETVVSNLRSSIAQSLRALADEIEEPQ